MQTFFLDSTHFEILRVDGADAQRFLQGQLSCDIDALEAMGWCRGTACNTKGRVITPFIVVKRDADFLLLFAAGLSALFLGALKKFLPFYKCTMEAVEEPGCLGLGGDEADEVVKRLDFTPPPAQHYSEKNGTLLLKLGNETPQYLFLAPAGNAVREELETLPVDDGALWQALNMLHGHYPFVAEDSERFTPQELDYDRKGYVSFTKGCYTGQEIVARMHYRGKVKRQLFLLTIDQVHEPDGRPTLVDEADKEIACEKTVRLDADTLLALATLPVEYGEGEHSLQTAEGSPVSLRPF